MSPTEYAEYQTHCVNVLAKFREHNIEIVEQFWSKGLLHLNVVLDGTPRTLTVTNEESK